MSNSTTTIFYHLDSNETITFEHQTSGQPLFRFGQDSAAEVVAFISDEQAVALARAIIAHADSACNPEWVAQLQSGVLA